MIKTTTWTPDTCKCVVIYEWDTEVPEAKRTHTVVDSNPCDLHADSGDHSALYSKVLTENQGKNRAYDDACIAAPSLLPENFQYSFDEGRNLIITLKDVSDTDAATVQTALVSKHPTVSITLASDAVIQDGKV